MELFLKAPVSLVSSYREALEPTLLRVFQKLAMVALLTSATSLRSFCQSLPFDQAVTRLLAQHNVPSVSIAEIEGGKVTLVSAYGMQSADTSATTKTLYDIASMTKPTSSTPFEHNILSFLSLSLRSIPFLSSSWSACVTSTSSTTA